MNTKDIEEIRKTVKRIVREDYSIGGNFADDDRQGLCFKYTQLDKMEERLTDFVISTLTQHHEDR